MPERVKTNYPSVYYKIKVSKQTKKNEKVYYIKYRTPDGKQHHEKAGASGAGMTAAKANQLRTQRMTGKTQTNTERRKAEVQAKKAAQSKWTIEKLWEEFQIAKADVKALGHYQTSYRRRLEERFAKKAPNEIELRDIDKLKKDLTEQGYKPATIWQDLLLLKSIVKFGVDRKLCQTFTFKVKLPVLNNEKTEDLSKEQLRRLLKAIDKSQNVQIATMMKMVLFTGMRRGELMKLEWKDIDFERNFIHLRNPKGKKDQKIPLNSSTKEILENHNRSFPESPYIFTNKKGGRFLDPYKELGKIRDDTGLPKDFRPMHGLRHVYASMLASSGKVDMYTLQKLLTHKDSKMTQRYAHLRDEALQNASNVAGDIVGNLQS